MSSRENGPGSSSREDMDNASESELVPPQHRILSPIRPNGALLDLEESIVTNYCRICRKFYQNIARLRAHRTRTHQDPDGQTMELRVLPDGSGTLDWIIEPVGIVETPRAGVANQMDRRMTTPRVHMSPRARVDTRMDRLMRSPRIRMSPRASDANQMDRRMTTRNSQLEMSLFAGVSIRSAAGSGRVGSASMFSQLQAPLNLMIGMTVSVQPIGPAPTAQAPSTSPGYSQISTIQIQRAIEDQRIRERREEEDRRLYARVAEDRQQMWNEEHRGSNDRRRYRPY